MTVPGVVAADVEMEQMNDRVLSGRLKFTDDTQKQYEITL